MSTSLPRVLTPCVGVCSTGIGDDVCRGCKRFSHEVINWNSYSQQQKQLIEQRLDAFLAQVMEGKVSIVNAELLAWQLSVQGLRYAPHKSPLIWLYQLLRAGAGQIDQPRRFGFIIDPAWQERSPVAIREAIDREFYELSRAHYERYIGRFVRKEA